MQRPKSRLWRSRPKSTYKSTAAKDSTVSNARSADHANSSIYPRSSSVRSEFRGSAWAGSQNHTTPSRSHTEVRPPFSLELNKDSISQSVTFDIDPSPIFTEPAVASAYSAYSQRCGPDLDAAATSDYPLWLVSGGDPTIAVTADAYTSVLGVIEPQMWGGALHGCQEASRALVEATQSAAAATPTVPTPTGSFTGIPQGECQVLNGIGGITLPGCTSTSTGTGTSTVTSGPSPTSQAGGAPVQSGGGANPGQSSGGGGGSTQTQTSAPPSSTPGGAATQRPIWMWEW
jgi:hypothetical protein